MKSAICCSKNSIAFGLYQFQMQSIPCAKFIASENFRQRSYEMYWIVYMLSSVMTNGDLLQVSIMLYSLSIIKSNQKCHQCFILKCDVVIHVLAHFECTWQTSYLFRQYSILSTILERKTLSNWLQSKQQAIVQTFWHGK